MCRPYQNPLCCDKCIYLTVKKASGNIYIFGLPQRLEPWRMFFFYYLQVNASVCVDHTKSPCVAKQRVATVRCACCVLELLSARVSKAMSWTTSDNVKGTFRRNPWRTKLLFRACKTLDFPLLRWPFQGIRTRNLFQKKMYKQLQFRALPSSSWRCVWCHHRHGLLQMLLPCFRVPRVPLFLTHSQIAWIPKAVRRNLWAKT